MNIVRKNLLLCVCLTTLCCQAFAGGGRPTWVRGNLPEAGNTTYYFKVTSGQGVSIAEARNNAIMELVGDLARAQGVTVKGVNILESLAEQNNGHYSERTTDQSVYKIEIDSFGMAFEIADTYVEGNTCWLLLEVARDPKHVMFDPVTTTTRYGISALGRSVVPGWGQLYKGSTAKGLCIIAGEAVCAGGIIVCEGLRADYTAKIGQTHDIQKITAYADYANNYATGRNICIGAAAALYVYNLIDAIGAPGAKRIVRIKNSNYTFMPVATPDYAGLKLAIHF
jgi:hypothetical protein